MDLLHSFRDNCGFGLLASIKNTPSHKNLEDAITALERMMHRGAIAADGKSGDGSGILVSMPKKFMHKVAQKHGVVLPEQFGVASIFYTHDSSLLVFSDICEKNDLRVLFTREVPIDTHALGKQALETLPKIVQVFVAPNSLMATKRFESMLYLSRKECERSITLDEDFYICSFSDKLLSYKGLFMPTHIKEFYQDLNSKDFEISFCLFHQRFSTNTLPKWKLAQPFRNLAHNGEINSITANRFNTAIKCESLTSSVFTAEEIAKMLPVLESGVSDSASLDNMFEFLVLNGMDFFKAARALIPAPWQNAPYMDPKLRAFYEYTSTCFEAWDGPAAVSLTDGRYVACILDRNGLRPAKYIITKDERLIISSEYGVLDIDEEDIVERGRLQSGQMIGLDLKFGRVLKNDTINEYLKNSNPYGNWLNEHMVHLQENIDGSVLNCDEYAVDELTQKQRYFNITHEVVEQVIEPMIKEGKEAVGSMGDDTPLACFSDSQRSFSDYFRQKFAQVTNPPIDPYREKVVMSLNTGFGEIHNMIDEDPNHAKRLKVTTPILQKDKLDLLLSFGDERSPLYKPYYAYKIFDTTYTNDLQSSLESLVNTIISDVKDGGIRIVVLDDSGVSLQKSTIPMAMAVGRVNYALLDAKIRHLVTIVSITGEVHDSHSAAVLIGYGASAIYPYMLFATIDNLLKKDNLDNYAKKERYKNVEHALNAGLLKIMSKMGISTIASYRSSALFDVIGLGSDIVKDCFRDSYLLMPGLGYFELEKINKKNHQEAFFESVKSQLFPLKMGGFYKYVNEGEYHDYEPQNVFHIHRIAQSGKKDDFVTFSKKLENRGIKMIRDCFEFKSDRSPIEIKEVEPKEEIFKRFDGAAMSLGSISPEAHEMIAEALNRIGGKSNSGEGGEDEARFKTIKNSKIKQVASGRFGVTPAYLRSATELQIKVAQGAKPGEGGQLPGHKVTPLIASLRYTMPGVTLISPPPHHDIYSIEDLAQLIFDLKQVNPDARVAVKLVSTAGVGTIAAGVAKAYADKIIISGNDGGTGAAPLSSIKFAGNPWELGLSEAHNALKVNHLREFVELQTDGGLKTGRDIVKAAMLGAESFAFGTLLLTIVGCKILRICHLNRCTVGVATQDARLREHYVGSVDRLINYFTLLAEDTREVLASLGYRSIDELVGRNELLGVKSDEKASKFDFSQILVHTEGHNKRQKERNEPFDSNEFEKEVLKEIKEVIKNPKERVSKEIEIKNTNRSFGALLSGEIAKYYGNKGLPEDAVKLSIKGVAGQSFGAFLIEGLSLYLVGAANDYVCKGMHGGKVVITPKNQSDTISCAGNTCLYGATGGKLFIAANAGERFAVRNSGALAIVEGTGDHACEYMTGGIVLILGKTGVNFGAGMTGGLAFVYDKEHDFIDHVNQELIQIKRIDTDEAEEAKLYLKKILKEHYSETKSKKAEMIIANFRDEIRNFWMVVPKNLSKLPLPKEEGN